MRRTLLIYSNPLLPVRRLGEEEVDILSSQLIASSESELLYKRKYIGGAYAEKVPCLQTFEVLEVRICAGHPNFKIPVLARSDIAIPYDNDRNVFALDSVQEDLIITAETVPYYVHFYYQFNERKDFLPVYTALDEELSWATDTPDRLFQEVDAHAHFPRLTGIRGARHNREKNRVKEFKTGQESDFVVMKSETKCVFPLNSVLFEAYFFF